MSTRSNQRKLVIAILLVVPLFGGWYGCFTTGPNGGTPPPPPPGGFAVNVEDITSTGVILQTHSGGQIDGSWVKDESTSAVGNVFSFPFENQPYGVVGGREPAYWDGAWQTNDWCGSGPNSWGATVPAAGYTLTVGDCVFGGGFLLNSEYVQTNSLPSTITIQSSGLTANNGMPQLTVFNASQLISQTLATSVASGGTSATFTFPTNSNGTALGSGVYTYTLQNQTTPKVFNTVGGNFFSVGTDNTTYTSPLGIDLGTVTTQHWDCINNILTLTSTTVVPSQPVVTLSSSAEIQYGTVKVPVGSEPTAVKIYQYVDQQHGGGGRGSCSGETDITTPSTAVSANYASNTVTVADVIHGTALHTITVGTQPVSLAISGNTAYVANYGSGTISVVNLTSDTVSNTLSIGSNPAFVVMDPSGTAFWVGGLNYISKVSTSSLTVQTTYTVSGQVTSLAIASGQNDYVYTILTNNNSTFMAVHANLTGGQAHTDYQQAIPAGSPFTHPRGDVPSAPPTWVVSNGPVVSTGYGNRYVIECTPTGFIVMDLQTGIQMLQGSTASEVTGIATDPAQGLAYMTEQASNAVISVPLPPQD